MLRWALGFFVVAIVAGILGFSGVAAGASEAARLGCLLFAVVFVLSLIGARAGGRKPAARP
jgi:uncharacterized membrane protein YtjA (UPF0391 family)